MSIDKLKSYLRSLSRGELDDILDRRDARDFDNAWCQVYEVVDEAEVQIDEEDLFRELSDVVAQHEIVSYIVDDLLMLKKADLKGVSPPFVLYLKDCYEKGVVPHEWKN